MIKLQLTQEQLEVVLEGLERYEEDLDGIQNHTDQSFNDLAVVKVTRKYLMSKSNLPKAVQG